MLKILIVEDDVSIATGLKIRLRATGFETAHVTRIKEARELLAKGNFSAVILDVNLPDGTGFELLREIKSTSQLPVLMLTAQTDPLMATKGLIDGASDYIRKPFSQEELLARLQNVLNRSVQHATILNAGKLAVHLEGRRVLFGEANITLTKREFEILAVLAKRGDGTVSRADILDRIDQEGAMTEKTLDSHIFNLRKKLVSATSGIVTIETEYGIGYALKTAA